MQIIHHFILIENKNIRVEKDIDYYLKVLRNLIDEEYTLSKDSKILDVGIIHDDLFSYFYEFFDWIEVEYPYYRRMTLSENKYGISIIGKENRKFKVLIKNIKDILYLCPADNITLIRKLYSDTISFEKNLTIDNLNKIINMFDKLKNNDNLEMVHYGI